MSGVSIATGVIATDALGGGTGRGLQSPGVLAQSAVPASVTGTLSETVLATISIPAGAMGVNGAIRVQTQWSTANNANMKTLQVRFGGTAFSPTNLANSVGLQGQTVIRNRGAANSQVSNGSMVMTTTGSSSSTGAVDSTVAQNLTISVTLANTGDTVTLEGYTVEILNP